MLPQPLETEDCMLMTLTPEQDRRGTILKLMEVEEGPLPIYLLSRWWPDSEAEAWAAPEGYRAFICIAGRIEVTLLSFRRYGTLCPAAFAAWAALSAEVKGLPGGLPDEMECFTETVILDANAPRLLSVPADVFAFLRTRSLGVTLLTTMNPETTVGLSARLVEGFLG